MILTFQIKTVSEANQSEHWMTKRTRKKQQQRDFSLQWKQEKAKVGLPATVKFTRYSCNVMDTDNLAGAFKHVQDALAKEIGIDDGDKRITWLYAQERIGKRIHYFTVEVLCPASE